jgi:sarcosine oxidase subunit delta
LAIDEGQAMKVIHCPLNGPRPLLEFVCGGELRDMPDPDSCSDGEWAAYLFNRDSVPGVKREWWCHVPLGYWFIAERDTSADVFLRTYDSAELSGVAP